MVRNWIHMPTKWITYGSSDSHFLYHYDYLIDIIEKHRQESIKPLLNERLIRFDIFISQFNKITVLQSNPSCIHKFLMCRETICDLSGKRFWTWIGLFKKKINPFYQSYSFFDRFLDLNFGKTVPFPSEQDSKRSPYWKNRRRVQSPQRRSNETRMPTLFINFYQP